MCFLGLEAGSHIDTPAVAGRPQVSGPHPSPPGQASDNEAKGAAVPLEAAPWQALPSYYKT